MIQLNNVIYVVLLLLAFTLIYCKQDQVEETFLESNYVSLTDSVRYMGVATCRSCHNNIHKTFIETGMGQSFNHATKSKTAATYHNHDVVYDENSDLYYKPYCRDSVLQVRQLLEE